MFEGLDGSLLPAIMVAQLGQPCVREKIREEDNNEDGGVGLLQYISFFFFSFFIFKHENTIMPLIERVKKSHIPSLKFHKSNSSFQIQIQSDPSLRGGKQCNFHFLELKHQKLISFDPFKEIDNPKKKRCHFINLPVSVVSHFGVVRNRVRLAQLSEVEKVINGCCHALKISELKPDIMMMHHDNGPIGFGAQC